MANTKYLSKIHLGQDEYLLKDSEARKLIKGNEDAIKQLQAGGLVIKIAESGIEGLSPEDYKGVLVLVPQEGAEKNIYVEYVVVDKGPLEGPAQLVFERIGTTEADLTDYVKNTRKVAGKPLSADISAQDIHDAMGLQAFAKKSEATGKFHAQAIDGVTATGSVSGNATITFGDASATVASKTITPVVKKKSGATVTVTNTQVAPRQTAEGGVVLEGEFTQPNISVIPATITADTLLNAGTLPSKVKDDYTAPSLTGKEGFTFAKAGLVANVTGGDEEGVLNLTNADLAGVMDGVTWNAGSFTEGQFNQGVLPTLKKTEIHSGVLNASASGGAYALKPYAFALTSGATTVTDAVYESEAVDVTNEVTYSKPNANASVKADNVSLAVGTINVAEQDITVR